MTTPIHDGPIHATRPTGPAVSPATSWQQSAEGILADHTCLWQDLDGLHVEPAPTDPPPTSILWAWSSSGAMVRVRLDGQTAYVATCPHDVPTTPVHPWAPDDRRVHAVRVAATSQAGLDLLLEQYVDDGLRTGTGPVTFLRARRA